jgi:hypothetical protein
MNYRSNLDIQTVQVLQQVRALKILRNNTHLVLVFNQARRRLEVSFNHLRDEGVEIDATLPTKDAFSLGRVPVEEA